MTGSGELIGADVEIRCPVPLSEGQEQLCHALQERGLAAALSELGEGQRLLREDFERLAGAVAPLLTKQYRDREQRIRALEIVIRNRQERPVIQQMAKLLADVRGSTPRRTSRPTSRRASPTP